MHEFVIGSYTTLFSMGCLAGMIITLIIAAMCGVIKSHKDESEKNG